MPRFLLDNDVAAKLAQYDLAQEAVTFFGGADLIEVLPTLRFRFRLNSPGKAEKALGSAGAVARLAAFVAVVQELEDTPREEFVATLASCPGIDPGEAVLFSVAAAGHECMIYTGDKRALAALASAPAARQVAELLRGRVKCIEQLVAEMMVSLDAQRVVTKLRGGEWDLTLRICSSSGSESDVLDALYSYYRYLNNECEGLLAPFLDRS